MKEMQQLQCVGCDLPVTANHTPGIGRLRADRRQLAKGVEVFAAQNTRPGGAGPSVHTYQTTISQFPIPRR